jgi:HlyD family secretion protein
MTSTKPLLLSRPLKPDQFLPAVGQWAVWGGLVLVGSVGLAIALAASLKYSTSVKASTIVRPSGGLRWVQAGVAGRVSDIRMQVNQPVRRGDVIAQLDATQLNTQKQQLQTSLQQEQAQLNQLRQQAQLLDAKITAEANSTQKATQIAAAELARDQDSFDNQRLVSRSELAEAEAGLALATSEYRRYQQLGRDVVSPIQIEEKLAAVRVAQQRVKRAKAVLNPSTAPLAIARQRLAQVESTGQSTLATLRQEKAVVIQQQSALQVQTNQTQQTLRQLQSELNQTMIRATGDGVILRLMLRNPNQVVQAGETLAEIAPSRDALSLKAIVAPQDISSVRLGQTAHMRVTACPYPDYGLLKGEVVAISPDVVSAPASGSPSPGSSPPPQPSGFEVIIRPERLELVHSDRRCVIQAGMEAEATIIAREETFLRFLLRKVRLLGNL